MIVKVIREVLGWVIVLVDWITRPKKIIRTEQAQRSADEDARGLALYQFYACPFCVKTRRAIHRLNVYIELRDAQKEGTYRSELLKEAGKVKVPCLRVEENGQVKWMYESNDIISYLNTRFGS